MAWKDREGETERGSKNWEKKDKRERRGKKKEKLIVKKERWKGRENENE